MISKLLAILFVFLCIEYSYQQQYNQCYALANIDYYGNDLPCKLYLFEID